MSSPRVLVAAAMLVGCAGSNGRDSPEPGTDVTLAPPATTASSVAIPLDARPRPSATAVPASQACLMWQECGCNEGCVAVRTGSGGVQYGSEVTVLSGPRKGKAFVWKATADDGSDVPAVSSRDPKSGAIYVCETKRASAFLGYLCEVSKSGPMRRGACDEACKEP